MSSLLECCFTFTETVGLLGTGAQDVRLDFHTAPQLSMSSLVECCFTFTETVGLLGTGAQDVHLHFHTAPELSMSSLVECCFTVHRNCRLIRDGEPRTSASTFTQLLSSVCHRVCCHDFMLV